MKKIRHLLRLFTVFVSFTVFCGAAFANDLLIILPYDRTYADTRGDPQWVEIGEMFANYKEITGLEARAITLEQVKGWHEGADEAEQVKRTIHSFARNQGTRYVMLVGDTGVFPIRQQLAGYTLSGDSYYHGVPGGWEPRVRDYYRFFPTDAYFANLWADDASPDIFDDWNANDNHLYGEMYHNALRSEDDFSYRPDVAVGRVPVETPEAFLNYLLKVMRYETRTMDLGGEQAALLLAGDVSGARDSISDLASLFESAHQVSQLWKTDTDYQYDGDFGSGTSIYPEDYIADFFASQLPQFVHYAGHGNPTWWAEVGVDSSLASRLANHFRSSIITTTACKTAQFAQRQHTTFMPGTAPADADEDGMAEALVAQGAGGGVVYIASTTGVILPIGYDLWPAFYAAIFDDGVRRVGDAFRQAIEFYIDDNRLISYSDGGSWQEDETWPGPEGGYYSGLVSEFAPVVTTLLFGDPSLRIHGVDYSHTPPTTRAEYRRWVNGEDLAAGTAHLHGITFHAHDVETRVAATYWRAQEAPDGPWSAFQQGSVAELSIDLSTADEGDQLLFSYYSVDDEGNMEILNTDEIGFDYTPPVTSVYVDGLPYNAAASEAIPFRDVNVELRATDATSGVQFVEYIFGEGTEGTQNPGGRLPLDLNFPCFSGTYTLQYRAVDAAGNREAWRSVAIELEAVEAARVFCFGEWIEPIRYTFPPRFVDTLPLLEFFERPEATDRVEGVRFEFQGPFETMEEGLNARGTWRSVGKAKQMGTVWQASWNPRAVSSADGFFRIRAITLVNGKAEAMPPYWIHVKK